MSSSGQNDAGLMSSAGLVRYFDSEQSNGIVIDPRTWLAFSLLVGFLVRMGNILAA